VAVKGNDHIAIWLFFDFSTRVVVFSDGHDAKFALWHSYTCQNALWLLHNSHDAKFRYAAVCVFPERVVVVFFGQKPNSQIERNIYKRSPGLFFVISQATIRASVVRTFIHPQTCLQALMHKCLYITKYKHSNELLYGLLHVVNACGRSNCAFIFSILTVFGVTNVRYGTGARISELLENIAVFILISLMRATPPAQFISNTVIFLVKCKIILTKFSTLFPTFDFLSYRSNCFTQYYVRHHP